MRSIFPQIFSVPRGKNVPWIQAHFRCARIARTFSITMPILLRLRLCTLPRGEKLFLVFCLFVMLSKNKVCERHLAMKVLWYRNAFGTVD